MKTIRLKFTLLAISCFFSACLSAQTINKQGQYTIDHNIYTVSKVGDKESLLVEEKSGMLLRTQKNSKDLTRIDGGRFSGYVNINTSFVKILGMRRINELASGTNKIDIVVTLYLLVDNGKGRIQTVQFLILHPQITKLTFEEIDKLTSYMKENIIIEFSSNLSLGANVAPFIQSVSFSRLGNSLKK